jgi:hypothetical protein
MVDVEIGPVEVITAILAGVFIALKNVVPREFDLFFWQPLEKTEYDDSGYPDFQRDGLKHPWFRIGDGKMSPTRKIMGQEITRSVRCDNLRMTLIEEGECPPDRTGVDGLPQPVEDKNRLVEWGVHDIVDASYAVGSSAFASLSIVQV